MQTRSILLTFFLLSPCKTKFCLKCFHLSYKFIYMLTNITCIILCYISACPKSSKSCVFFTEQKNANKARSTELWLWFLFVLCNLGLLFHCKLKCSIQWRGKYGFMSQQHFPTLEVQSLWNKSSNLGKWQQLRKREYWNKAKEFSDWKLTNNLGGL